IRAIEAVPATVPGECRPDATDSGREGGRRADPEARRPATTALRFLRRDHRVERHAVACCAAQWLHGCRGDLPQRWFTVPERIVRSRSRAWLSLLRRPFSMRYSFSPPPPAAGVLLLALAIPAVAAPLSDDMVVTATRSPHSLGRIATTVRVIDVEQIRASGARNLSEVLRNLGPVQV